MTILFSSHDNISIINHTQRANARRDWTEDAADSDSKIISLLHDKVTISQTPISLKYILTQLRVLMVFFVTFGFFYWFCFLNSNNMFEKPVWDTSKPFGNFNHFMFFHFDYGKAEEIFFPYYRELATKIELSLQVSCFSAK